MIKNILAVLATVLCFASAMAGERKTEKENAHATQNEMLPNAKLNKGVAKISVQVAGYKPEKALSVMVGGFTPIGSQEELMLSVPLNEDGTAVVEIPMYMVQRGMVEIEEVGYASVILAPNEEIAIMASLDGEEGKITEFKGYMAQTHTDLNSLEYDMDEDSRKLCEELSKCTTPQERLDCLRAEMNKMKAYVNALPVTEAAKAILRMGAESNYFDWVYRFGLSYVGVRSYLRMIDRPSPEEYSRLMDECNALLPAPPFGSIGTEEYFELLGAPYAPCMDDFLRWGTPMTGYVDKDGKVNTYNRDIRTMQTLIRGGHEYNTDELFATIEHEDCKLFAEQCLAERHQKAAELSQKNSVFCHSHDDVAPENILQVILDKYKGKAVLIDIWATWCVPCLKGHEAMKPLKEELSGQDVVFVNITSPASPMSTWEEMIADIAGEHYYLTEQQLSYILTHYGSTGFPTYAIYNKDGEQTFVTVGFSGLEEIQAEMEKAMK